MIATAAVSVLLAALLAWSAVLKLSLQEHVVQQYLRVGVPRDKLKYLAMILLAAAAGLLLGLLWRPLGIVTALALTAYFTVAVAFHVRAGDWGNLPTPLAYAALAVLALILRLM